jgi:MSHA pilin protein MshA
MKTNTAPRKILNNQGGFTLIELIMVIVILGILSVVAIPKYVDMQKQAAEAAADGVFGAAQGAAAINFAAGLVGAARPAGAMITTGALLLSAMDGTPEGWSAGAGTSISATVGTVAYTIDITSVETTAAKAVLSKSW